MEGKNNQEKKEITLDDVARITHEGFLSIEGKIDGVEGKLDRIETEVKEIRSDLNKKVDRFDHNELTYRVDKLEEICA